MDFFNGLVQACLGVAFGMVSAAGTYALLTVFGLLPRLTAVFHQGQRVRTVELAVVAGVTFGNIADIWLTRLPIGGWILPIMGLSFGIYVGTLIMALAETLQVFPVLFRRFGLNRGMKWLIFSFAAGKMVGSLIYYLLQFG